MEENQSSFSPENTKNEDSMAEMSPNGGNYAPFEVKVRVILLTLLGAILGGALLGPMLYQVLAAVFGWDTGLVAGGGFSEHATASERAQMRLFLGLSHFATFTLSGIFTAVLFYRGPQKTGTPHWADYLRLRHWPDARLLALSILLMMVSMPLVLFLYNINKALPLPEWLRMMEQDTNEALKGLLQMDGWGELAANLLIIALLPALGEELLFRGILQQQLMRRTTNPWVAIAWAALIFSFIHFQFEGFFSRALLGLLLGWLYWISGNFWVPVAAHFFNNGAQVVGQYLYGKNLSTVDLEQDVAIPWTAALASALLVLGVAYGIHALVASFKKVEL